MEDDMFKGFLDDPIDGFINKYKSKFGKATDYYTSEVVPTLGNSGRSAPLPSTNAQGNDQYEIRSGAQRNQEVQDIQEEGEILGKYIYGSTRPLTEAEKNKMAAMEQREGRLQPVDFGVLGGRRIAGNPFSIDTRGLMTGLGNLGEGIINKERAKHRGEFFEELEGYREQEAENQAIEQGRQKFLKQFVPQSYFNRMAREAEIRASNRTHNQKLEFEEEKHKNEKETIRLRNQLEKELKAGKSPEYSSQVVQDYFKARYPGFYNLESVRNSYLKQRSDLLYDPLFNPNTSLHANRLKEIDSALSRTEDQMESLGSMMVQEMKSMGVVPPSDFTKDRYRTDNLDVNKLWENTSVTLDDVKEYAKINGISEQEAIIEFTRSYEQGALDGL